MQNITVNKGTCLHIVNTNKFKDVTISIRFASRITKRNPTLRSLLGMMLVDRTQKYDEKRKMQKELDYLYGANLYYKITGYGELHVLEIKSQVVNERYTQTSLLEEQFALLEQVVCYPLLNESVFNEAKRLLKEKLERNLDNPSTYASKKLLQKGASQDVLSIYASGDLEVLETVTLAMIKEEYEHLCKDNQVDIFVVGDVNEKNVCGYVERYLAFTGCVMKHSYYSLKQQDYQREVETKDIQQSILSQLYRTKITIADADYWALRIMNGMLGAFPVSLLFQEVREKRSLCYSIYSSVIAYDGALVIQTGISQENIALVEEVIHAQIVRLQTGDFPDELVTISKDMMMNGLLTNEDSVSSIIGLGYQNLLLHKEDTLQMYLEAIKKISKEDIVRIAQQMELQYTYILKQEVSNEETV